MRSPERPGFLKPKELAARWRVSRTTVYDLIAGGHLPSYQLGGSIRMKWTDVLAYEDAGYQAAVIRPKALRRTQPRAG